MPLRCGFGSVGQARARQFTAGLQNGCGAAARVPRKPRSGWPPKASASGACPPGFAQRGTKFAVAPAPKAAALPLPRRIEPAVAHAITGGPVATLDASVAWTAGEVGA